MHAAFAFAHKQWTTLLPWLTRSNFLVLVAVPDEAALYALITQAHERGIVHEGVREPDVNDEITAVALSPGRDAERLCASLPLALREVSMR